MIYYVSLLYNINKGIVKLANMKLTTYQWCGKSYTSQLSLNNLFIKKAIKRIAEPTAYGCHYTYLTHDGREIASFYKDSTFGFCSQACGILLANVTDLKNPVKVTIEDRVYWSDIKVFKACPTIRRMVRHPNLTAYMARA